MQDSMQAIAIRNRIIGTLVKRARLKAGKSRRECAELLGCSSFAFGQYEQGRWGLSLSQLEVLTRLFKVPLDNLWDDSSIPPDEPEEDAATLRQAMLLRRKILAVQFRQCRRAGGLTQKEMGQLLGRSAGIVGRYERGERDIPLGELEVAAERCGKSLVDFYEDQAYAPDQAEVRLQTTDRLSELPPDVREFVLKPTNALYLRIALLLSSMKADSLRQIAETLLDITL
ncbi:MAG: XRE family transcriptional regulator [Anaerolineae bacterium]|nr:XRE family transcriptional regulator [Anaerolineae bacterium]